MSIPPCARPERPTERVHSSSTSGSPSSRSSPTTTPATVRKSNEATARWSTKSRGFWADIRSLRWVVVPSTSTPSRRLVPPEEFMSFVIPRFFPEDPAHLRLPLGHLGICRAVRSSSSRHLQPVRPSPLHLAPHTHILSGRPALPQRLPRPRLPSLLRRVLVICAPEHHDLPLPADRALVRNQEGGEVGPVRRAGVCNHLLCVHVYLGHGAFPIPPRRRFMESSETHPPWCSTSCPSCPPGGTTPSTFGSVRTSSPLLRHLGHDPEPGTAAQTTPTGT